MAEHGTRTGNGDRMGTRMGIGTGTDEGVAARQTNSLALGGRRTVWLRVFVGEWVGLTKLALAASMVVMRVRELLRFRRSRSGRWVSRRANGELVVAGRSWEPGEGPVVAVLFRSRRKGYWVALPALEGWELEGGFLYHFPEGSLWPDKVYQPLEALGDSSISEEKRELLAAAFTCPQCGQLDPDVWQLGECAQCWAVERGLLNNVGRPSVFNDLAAT